MTAVVCNATTGWQSPGSTTGTQSLSAYPGSTRPLRSSNSNNRPQPSRKLSRSRLTNSAMVFDAIDAHARAAGIVVVADGTLPPRLELRASSGQLAVRDDRLTLQREDALLRATFTAASRMEQQLIALDDPAFEAEPAALRLAEAWCAHIELSQGGLHVTR